MPLSECKKDSSAKFRYKSNLILKTTVPSKGDRNREKNKNRTRTTV